MDLIRGQIRIPGGRCCRVWWRSWKVRAERPTGQRRSSETPRIQSSKFKVQSSKFKVQSSKFKVQSSRFKVQGSKFKVQSSKFKVQSSKFWYSPRVPSVPFL